MKFLDSIPRIFKSFYFLVGTLAFVWLLFFDTYNLVSQVKTRNRVEKLEQDLAFYQKGKTELEKQYTLLTGDDEALERFAREEFYMRKKGEDVFLIEE